MQRKVRLVARTMCCHVLLTGMAGAQKSRLQQRHQLLSEGRLKHLHHLDDKVIWSISVFRPSERSCSW